MRKDTDIDLRTQPAHGTFDKSLRTFGAQALELKSVFRTTQFVRQVRGINLWPLLGK